MNRKKFIYYLLFIFISIFAFSNNVNAIGFRQMGRSNKGVGCYNPTTFEYYGTAPTTAGAACAKGVQMWYKVDDKGNNAYCTNEALALINNDDLTYRADADWNNRKTKCEYIKNSKRVSGACSVILGYIINEARKDTYIKYTKGQRKEYQEAEKNYNAQAAVWGYLANFGKNYGSDTTNKLDNRNFKLTNKNFYSVYTKSNSTNQTIRNIIINGVKAYSAAMLDRNTDEIVEKDDLTFNVNGLKGGFLGELKYSPECGASNYITNYYELKNETNANVKYTFSINGNKKIEICDESNNCVNIDEKTVSLVKGETYKFKLKTYGFAGNSLSLKITGTYSISSVAEKPLKILSTKRYVRVASPQNLQHQGVIVPDTIEEENGITEIHTTTQTYTISQKKITSYTCSSGSDTSSESINSSAKSSVCANENADGSGTQVKYGDCQCTVITLNDGTKIKVLIKETVDFMYGSLVYNSIKLEDNTLAISSGLGFRFVTDSDLEGVKTKYMSKIEWQYADFDINGSPYIYSNKENYNPYNAAMTNSINDEIKKKMESSKSLIFKTLDSNTGEATEYVLNLKLNITNEEDKYSNGKVIGKTLRYEMNNIELKNAYFASDATVKYYDDENGDDIYNILGGKYYYTPMRFDRNNSNKNSFYFNIKANTDLALITDFDFLYEGKCSLIPVDNYTNKLRYRSIDVTNPFPKAGNNYDILPLNWRDWYKSNLNQQRIAQTYEKYSSNNALYTVDLSADAIKNIRKNQINYSDWTTNINDNGTSNFINDGLYSKKANNESYCRIGEFKESCDRSR